ncbi:MAG: YggS family pyridoxal phosphate-dependent enzyme [Clostridia bacterium]|nr:YggS family pyridoxal phosphate-dependent enzyme [Clostridia bacterium]
MMEKSSIEIFNQNYEEITEKIALAAEKSGRTSSDITLLAATKTVPANVINHAISSGITHIGENRVQEFLQKEPDLTKNVHKHFIGHLQTNKVKDIVGKVELIQSVDSIKLAKVIAEQSIKKGIITEVLAEVNVGLEPSKSGFMPDAVLEAVDQISEIKGISLAGLMAIPPICDNLQKNIQYFDKMYKLFVEIKDKKIYNNIKVLSMGMSDDYETAICCGSNMIRLGTALFGRRNYNI